MRILPGAPEIFGSVVQQQKTRFLPVDCHKESRYTWGMKICSICKVPKDEDEFNKHSGKADGLQTKCRLCSAKRSGLYYVKYKKRMRKQIREASNRRIEANCRKLVAYLKEHPCVDCGQDDPLVLDFDHVRGVKIKDVSTLVQKGYAWEGAEAEIKKCVVRCANCHRRKSARQRGDLRWKILGSKL